MLRMSRRVRTHKGAATVEFALVASLLMTLVIGLIGYGIMLSFRQAISQAAAEGARAAAVSVALADDDKATDATAAVNGALASYGRDVCEWQAEEGHEGRR
jgi:Flp pilus assembly protein TadG